MTYTRFVLISKSKHGVMVITVCAADFLVLSMALRNIRMKIVSAEEQSDTMSTESKDSSQDQECGQDKDSDQDKESGRYSNQKMIFNLNLHYNLWFFVCWFVGHGPYLVRNQKFTCIWQVYNGGFSKKIKSWPQGCSQDF